MVIEADENQKEEYDAFYDVISAPVDSHIITFPYGQDTLTFEAYVTSGEDEVELIDVENETTQWGEITLQFIAMEPNRQ